jgi:hypothetical protein
MRAGYDAGKDPELFIKLMEQVHGKPVQPTTVANPDGTNLNPGVSPNVLMVTVTGEGEVKKIQTKKKQK